MDPREAGLQTQARTWIIGTVRVSPLWADPELTKELLLPWAEPGVAGTHWLHSTGLQTVETPPVAPKCLMCVGHSVEPDSLCPHGLQLARLPCPWDSLGKNTGVGSHSLLQRISPTQGWNPGLPALKADSSRLG